MPEQPSPATRLTLIGALRQGLRWEEFVALYGQLILHWGRRDFGLQDSDAENLRQEVLIRVWRSIGRYEPCRGKFRNWLYGTTRNVVYNLWNERRGERVAADALEVKEQLDNLPAPELTPGAASENDDLDRALETLEEDGFASEALQSAVLRVRERVQPANWTAYLLFEFFDMRAREVALRVGMTPAAVNQAVHRIRTMLQEVLQEPAT
jgi:RNA polymerase sigma-70 factor (ECF subfamily)